MILTTHGKGTFEAGQAVIRQLTAGTLSLLDLGCGEGTHTRGLPVPCKLFADADPGYYPSTPRPFARLDLRTDLDRFADDSFEVVLALDVIEHLQKSEGPVLLSQMERIASKRVVLFTPLGEMWVNADKQEFHHHKCGWLPEEFAARGYQVWAWPEFHHWPDGSIFGAFFAWRSARGQEIFPKDARARAGL